MIGSLRGTVLEHSPTGEAILEVGGVGYRVLVPAGTPGLVPGEPAFVFTHLHVREDALILYGFSTRDARDTFESLLGATGVGPKLALAIVSVHGPAALRQLVLDADADALTLVPGVGKRTAQRLLLELQSRLEVDARVPDGVGEAPTRGRVRDALAGLGYGPDEVRDALAGLDGDESAEQLLRDALRRLAGARV
ncbi:MAG TPA: Holliday junction branch migration protein RuvA [Acidimicrobiia bacterium]|jgi:Holliday junction DNA helicase RuvA